ncbi:MAG: DUF4956 domain-containing protein [Bacteroidota bacterium]
MFDFVLTHNHTENPTALGILITVLCAFFLASVLVLTYELTTKAINRPVHFLQAMVLISIVAATVMQAIGDSLARGLGMLGALAIIRFRTVLDNPRNMAFMFAALATGIACGVFGFTIAFIGTFGFCTAAVLLRFSPLANTDDLVGTLKIDIPIGSNLEQQIEQILTAYCAKYVLKQVRFLNLRKTGKIKDLAGNVIEEKELENLKEFNYQVRLHPQKSKDEFANALEQLSDVRDLRLKFDVETVRL